MLNRCHKLRLQMAGFACSTEPQRASVPEIWGRWEKVQDQPNLPMRICLSMSHQVGSNANMATTTRNPMAQLFSGDENPTPEGAQPGFITTPDEVRLRYAKWSPKLRPSKGTVLLLHGRTECIEKYYETVEDLRERGFGVLTFDWRGQGGSDRMLKDPRKGHVENFNQYLIDLETVLTELRTTGPELPLVGLILTAVQLPQTGHR